MRIKAVHQSHGLVIVSRASRWLHLPSQFFQYLQSLGLFTLHQGLLGSFIFVINIFYLLSFIFVIFCITNRAQLLFSKESSSISLLPSARPTPSCHRVLILEEFFFLHFCGFLIVHPSANYFQRPLATEFWFWKNFEFFGHFCDFLPTVWFSNN